MFYHCAQNIVANGILFTRTKSDEPPMYTYPPTDPLAKVIVDAVFALIVSVRRTPDTSTPVVLFRLIFAELLIVVAPPVLLILVAPVLDVLTVVPTI